MNSRDTCSPPDPEGNWFNANMADDAEGYYRQEFRPSPKPAPELARYREAAEAREASAKERGYEDFKHAMAAGLRHAGLASAPPRTRRADDES